MSEQQKQGGRKLPWYVRRKQKTVAPKIEPPKPKGNYAFIDSQNLNLGVQKMGWKMDWHKLRVWLAEQYGVTNAYMFIGYMQENEALYEQMYEHGFLVVLKPTLEIKQSRIDGQANKSRATDSGNGGGYSKVGASSDTKPARGEKTEQKTEVEEKSVVKGNIDADLVLHAMKELPNYDKAIIVSGDGDFFALVEYLIQQKKLLKLMTPNKRFSTLLQGFEEYIEGIDQHRTELAYHDFRKKRTQHPRRQQG